MRISGSAVLVGAPAAHPATAAARLSSSAARLSSSAARVSTDAGTQVHPGTEVDPGTSPDPTTDPTEADQVPWVAIVWNDPVNLMSYVTYVFQTLLGHPRPKAEKLMLDVHQKGRATVSHGTRDAMEAVVAQLHGAGLWATMAADR